MKRPTPEQLPPVTLSDDLRTMATYLPSAISASEAAALLAAADRLDELEAELALFVPVDDPFKVFIAGDGHPAIRGRTDLYERKETP